MSIHFADLAACAAAINVVVVVMVLATAAAAVEAIDVRRAEGIGVGALGQPVASAGALDARADERPARYQCSGGDRHGRRRRRHRERTEWRIRGRQRRR